MNTDASFMTVRSMSYHVLCSQSSETPALILLHGFLGSASLYAPLLDTLGSCCRPVAPDLLGHGSSSAPEDPQCYSAAEQVEDLRELTRSLVAEPFVLAGYSMGGRLALQYATRYPDTLRGLILESTTPGIRDHRQRSERREQDRQYASWMRHDLSSFLAFWENRPVFQSGRLPEDRQRQLRSVQQNQQPSAMAASLAGFGTGSMPCLDEQQLARLRIPTLILTGAHDQKFTRIGRQLEQQLPEARLYAVPATGHRVHLEAPDAYIQYITAFLSHLKS